MLVCAVDNAALLLFTLSIRLRAAEAIFPAAEREEEMRMVDKLGLKASWSCRLNENSDFSVNIIQRFGEMHVVLTQMCVWNVPNAFGKLSV